METNLIGETVEVFYDKSDKTWFGIVRGVHVGDKADTYGLSLLIQRPDGYLRKICTCNVRIPKL